MVYRFLKGIFLGKRDSKNRFHMKVPLKKNRCLLLAWCILIVNCKSVEAQITNNNVQALKQKNLIKMEKLITSYKTPYLNDHAVIYDAKGKKWHMFGIYKNPSTEFLHLTADLLTQKGWEKERPFTFQGKEIWAPHIIYHKDLFYMFYTSIGTPREVRYAVSTNLYDWEHPTSEPLLALTNEHTNNMKNKDPMVFRDKENDQWIMYYSMMKDSKHWVVGYSTSKNLTEWSAPQICFDEHTEEPNVESPFVVKRGTYYYLFLSARPWPNGGEDIFRSKTPYLWKTEDLVHRIDPWHAAEIVRDLDGKWYLTLCTGTPEMPAHDFRMASFLWNDGLENEETSMPVPSHPK